MERKMHRIPGLIFMAIVLLLTGCSLYNDSPVDISPKEVIDLPSVLTIKQSEHPRIMWNVNFDIENMVASVEPERMIGAHFNVTSIIPAISIVINSYDPTTGVIDVDTTIENPYGISVYDVRLIIFTDQIGHLLLNADDWTSLYDITGGLPINPFKAYNKSEIRRRFNSYLKRTENLQIYLPAGNPNVIFAIDISYGDNCEEPYQISAFSQGLLEDTTGSSTNVTVSVLDWQDDVSEVFLYCPVITGMTLVPFSKITSETWQAIVTNNNGVSAGEYQGFIIAKSAKSGSLALYDAVNIRVSVSTSDQGLARTWGGTGNDKGYNIVSDNDGNVFVTGYFKGTVDFDPGPEVEERQFGSGTDFYLVKFNSNGDFLWVITSDSIGATEGIGLICDTVGNIYLAGSFSGEVDFDPGVGEEIREPPSGNGMDAFLVKYDPDGNFVWVQTWGGLESDAGVKLDFDSSDYLYVLGYYEDTVDFNPGFGSDMRTSNGYRDIYISKFDTNGNYQWVRTWGGSSWMDNPEDIVLNSIDDIYTSGVFAGTVDFDPGSNFDNHDSLGLTDVFLTKLDSSGNFYWAKTWGGTNDDRNSGVAAAGIDSVYVFGDFWREADLDPGPGEDIHYSQINCDSFLSKFDTVGDYIWGRSWGACDNHCNGGVTVTDSAEILVTSSYYSTVDFDPGPEIYEMTSNGEWDVYMCKYNPSGDFIWARSWGGSKADSSYRIVTGINGNIYVTGEFRDTVDFDPGTGIDEHTSVGIEDIFYSKLHADGYW